MSVHELNPSTMPMPCGKCSTWENSIDIDELFARFQAVYGHRWNSQFPRDKNFLSIARAEWAAGLSDLTCEAISRGFRVCVWHCDFPPSIAEFRRFCLPSTKALGLPTVEEAMQMILKRSFLPQPVQEALDIVGKCYFRQGEMQDVKKKFTAAYQQAIEKYQLKAIQKNKRDKRLDNKTNN